MADSRLLNSGPKEIERGEFRLEAFGGPVAKERKCTSLLFVALEGDKGYAEVLWWRHIRRYLYPQGTRLKVVSPFVALTSATCRCASRAGWCSFIAFNMAGSTYTSTSQPRQYTTSKYNLKTWPSHYKEPSTVPRGGGGLILTCMLNIRS